MTNNISPSISRKSTVASTKDAEHRDSMPVKFVPPVVPYTDQQFFKHNMDTHSSEQDVHEQLASFDLTLGPDGLPDELAQMQQLVTEIGATAAADEVQSMSEVAMELVKGGLLDALADDDDSNHSLFSSAGSFAQQMHDSMDQFSNSCNITHPSSDRGIRVSQADVAAVSSAVEDFVGTALEELDVVSSGSILASGTEMVMEPQSDTEESSDDYSESDEDDDAEMQLVHRFESDWCDVAWRWDWLHLQYKEAQYHLQQTNAKIQALKESKKPAFSYPEKDVGAARCLTYNNRATDEKPAVVRRKPTKLILRTKPEPHPLAASDKNFAHRVALRSPPKQPIKLPKSPFGRVSTRITTPRKAAPKPCRPRSRPTSLRRSYEGEARQISRAEHKEIFIPSCRLVKDFPLQATESSDEDTSDEMYAKLHGPKEAVEHQRFVDACGIDTSKKRGRGANSRNRSTEKKSPKTVVPVLPPPLPDSFLISALREESPRTAAPCTPMNGTPRRNPSGRRKMKLKFSPDGITRLPVSAPSTPGSPFPPRKFQRSPPLAGKKRAREVTLADDPKAWKIAKTSVEANPKKNVLVLRKITVT